MTPQPFPLKSSTGNLPLSSYKLQDIHTLHVSCEIKAKVQIPQHFKHGYQISHPHENYDNQISSTTERKSVKCPGYAQKGEGRGVLKLQFGRYEEEEEKILRIFPEVILTLYAQGFWC